MKRILLFLTIFLSTLAFAGERVIINPEQDGDLKLKVNDGGVVKDALTIVGTTGQIRPGADGYDHSSLGDEAATRLGLKIYTHGVNYNSGISPTVSSGQAGFGLSGGNFIPYQMQDGTWRLKVSIQGTFTAATIASLTLSINGVTFWATASQALAGGLGSSVTNATIRVVQTTASSGTITLHANSSGTTAFFTIEGDVRLASKPTWAY